MMKNIYLTGCTDMPSLRDLVQVLYLSSYNPYIPPRLSMHLSFGHPLQKNLIPILFIDY